MRRLEQYGIMVAAGAGAGVGVAENAVAAPAGVTGVSIDIPASTAGYYLDIDGDGNYDLNIYQSYGDTSLVFSQPATTGVITTNGVATSNLASGTLISALDTFGYGAAILASDYPLYIANYGPFGFDSSTGGFIGLTFDIGGSRHYGWVEVSPVDPSAVFPTPMGQILGYGYDDTPDTGINAGVVPTPGSLALLALGAAGIRARRKGAAA